MRLFIAINFCDETIGRLLSLRDELRAEAVSGRFSAPENMHLTLVFLGECDARQTAAVRAAMDAVDFEPFPIRIERVGRFKRDGGRGAGPAKSVATWWAGVQEGKELLGLQRNLNEKLIGAGFALDTRRYSPHITLGREIVTDTAPWQVTPFGETVVSIELMKSERINGKLTYTAIHVKKGS